MTVKTAISLDAALFGEAEALAERMRLSRSRLVGLALDEFVRRHRARAMREKLDAVYGAEPAEEPTGIARIRRAAHRRCVEGTW